MEAKGLLKHKLFTETQSECNIFPTTLGENLSKNRNCFS